MQRALGHAEGAAAEQDAATYNEKHYQNGPSNAMAAPTAVIVCPNRERVQLVQQLAQRLARGTNLRIGSLQTTGSLADQVKNMWTHIYI